MNKSLAQFKNYKWRNGAHMPKEWAPIFGARADWLQERLGRAPKATDVLEDARSQKSPIHDMFNWDDEEAAEKFRKMQAGMLLTNLVVRVKVIKGSKTEEIDMPVRLVVNRAPNHGASAHEHIRDVLSDRDMRQKMLEAAADEMISIERRYSYLKELGRVFHEVDAVVKKKVPQLLHKIRGRNAVALAVAAR